MWFCPAWVGSTARGKTPVAWIKPWLDLCEPQVGYVRSLRGKRRQQHPRAPALPCAWCPRLNKEHFCSVESSCSPAPHFGGREKP